MTITLILICALVALPGAAVGYFFLYQKWERKNTDGISYFGKPLAQRRQLKQSIRKRSFFAWPGAAILASLARRNPRMPDFKYRGYRGPAVVSNAELFQRAAQYKPQSNDVFVATQMKCGTTWMQQIVYEVLNRGNGDMSDNGHGHLYATSPWIEASTSVSLEAAPLIGDQQQRIIKTHMPVALCPINNKAKYIYVARHPVSCFASCVDFTRLLTGPFAPPVDVLTDWFCSDKMFWGDWPQHVSGWWDRSQRQSNILFVHFEDLKADLSGQVQRIADFLQLSLTTEETQSVLNKCSFEYMKKHEELFEMSPPNMFSVATDRHFMASGTVNRHNDVAESQKQKIIDYCTQKLAGHDYVTKNFYPDLKQ